MFDKKTLGARIKYLRTEKQMSQDDLGKILGISKQTLSGIETGYRSTTIEILCKASDFFDVSTDYLVGRDDLPKRY